MVCEMQSVWITGGKGFVGRHLAAYAARQGCRVFGIGHGLWPPEHAARWYYSHWSNGEIESANLSQLASVSGRPDTIYHLAGGSSVGASLQNPHEDFRRTVETTARLLEWVRLNAAQTRVVGVSSAAVYGVGHSGPIAEDAAISPYSPYGVHKAMMENLFRSYCENFGLSAVLVRLFSVYGSGLRKQLLWDICSKLAAGGQLELGGTGAEIRDWLHVADAANVLWLARNECDQACRTLNGGTGLGANVARIAALVCANWGVMPEIRFSGTARRGDPAELVADIRRVRQLGFEPAVMLEEGIRETVEWFKSERGRSSSV